MGIYWDIENSIGDEGVNDGISDSGVPLTNQLNRI